MTVVSFGLRGGTGKRGREGVVHRHRFRGASAKKRTHTFIFVCVRACVRACERENDRGVKMAEVENFMKYRYRLKASSAADLPTKTYRDGNIVVDVFTAVPPPDTWLTKKTRGLNVFYFTCKAAVQEYRLLKKRSADDADDADGVSQESSYVYLPLEPGHMLWAAFKIDENSTVADTVEELLWRPITENVAEIIDWFVNFLDDDDEIGIKFTVSDTTKSFVRDYTNFKENGTPMGNLVKYIGELKNDGSFHSKRRPSIPIRCII